MTVHPDCTTIDCDNPGNVLGLLDMGLGRPHDVRYCQGCASHLWAEGWFTPHDADALHRAEQLSEAEARKLAEFEAAPPAPESFDAVAAVRRVMALVKALEEPVFRAAVILPDYDMGRNAGADDERMIIAQALRAAVKGDNA